MKHLFIAVAAFMLATPALAGSRGGGHGFNSLNVNVGVAAGRGGLVGSLLGSAHGKTGLLSNVNVTTTKGGILGLILGGGHNSRGGYGGHGGHCGC